MKYRLGQKLRMLRISRQLTQEEFSLLLNLGRAAYGNYEIGRRMPPLSLLVNIADFYGISVDDLVRKESSDLLVHCTLDEQRLLERYRSLNAYWKQDLLDYSLFRSYCQKNKRSTV